MFDPVINVNDLAVRSGSMSGMSEDNALYFVLGIAAGAALVWMLVRTIRMRL
jgi:hypothetical protein